MLDISLGRQLPWELMECLALEDLKPSLAILFNLMLCLLPSIFLAKIQSLSTQKKDGSKMLKFIFFEVSHY